MSNFITAQQQAYIEDNYSKSWKRI